MRSSLAAAAGSGSASEEAVARLLAAAERLGLGAASPRRPSSAPRLARGGGGRLGAIISSSSQVEVELTLAAQPAGAVQRPHSRLAAGSLRPERQGLQVQVTCVLPSQVVAPGAAAAAAATVTHVTVMMTVSLTS